MNDLFIVQFVITDADTEAAYSSTCVAMIDTCMDVECVVNVLPLNRTVFFTVIKFTRSLQFVD